MKFNDLVKLCEKLAPSQGSYGRLLESLNQSTESQKNKIDEVLKDCKNDVDMILLIEG